MCDDFETEDIRFNAAYNLPCFHQCYRSASDGSEENKSDGSGDIEIKMGGLMAPVNLDFQELYLRFANDE
jgi:hypothetical protein